MTEKQSGTIQHINVMPARFVTIKVATVVTGLTESAIRSKIAAGKWVEGREYKRVDGGIFVDLKGYEQWVLQAA